MKTARLLNGVSDPTLIRAFGRAKVFLRRRYVTGIGIGRARRGGELAETAVCIFVTEKLADELLPSRSRFPLDIDGIPVDVVVCQMRAHHQVGPSEDISKNDQPIRPGAMIGDGQHFGSVGMIVREKASNKLHALTCAHVLPGIAGSNVYHPADADPQNRCGTLGASLWDREGDVALVRLNRPADNLVIGTGLTLKPPQAISEGNVLRKCGYVSGTMQGRVSHFGTMKVFYSDHAPIEVNGFYIESMLSGQIISEEGDSGSVWYDPNNGASIGVEVAGDPGDHTNSGAFAFACLVSTAFTRLGLMMP